MAYYGQPQQGYGANPQNLQFYSSSYAQPVSGTSTPFQASYGGSQSNAYGSSSFGAGFAQPGVSGAMGTGQGGLRTGWLAAFGSEGYEGEPSLMEELGVNFDHIRQKTLAVLNPLSSRIDPHLMDDSDLAGPVVFFFLFGTFLLFSGKVHFGSIYGLALVGSVLLHGVLSLMAPPLTAADVANAQSAGHAPGSSHFSSSLSMARSCSILGYCLLPLVVTSLFGIALPMDTLLGYALTSAAIAWCTWSSSAMFCAVGRMTHQRGLVAYPLALFYVGFGIMSIFSSRGHGKLEANIT